MKTFALIGAAGFVAPRHMKAIRETGNELIAAVDKSDSVGIMDTYFPKASFFTEFERFDRFLEKLKLQLQKIDYLSICSPNYLHDAHIRYGLRYGSDVICEKPLVLNPWNLDALESLEKESGKTVNCILQLRLHPAVLSLKKKIENSPADKIWDVDLSYISTRGNWYYASWKGDESKSGGIATNIGIHLFDMLLWIFGPLKETIVHIKSHDRSSGYLELQKARVRWFLSINQDTLPTYIKERGGNTYRSLIIEGDEFEFSEGFNDLHTLSYLQIMNNLGYRIPDARPAVEITHAIRASKAVGLTVDSHDMAKLPLAKHPFN